MADLTTFRSSSWLSACSAASARSSVVMDRDYTRGRLLAAELAQPLLEGRHTVVHLLREPRGSALTLRRRRTRRPRGRPGVAIGTARLQSVLALTHAISVSLFSVALFSSIQDGRDGAVH